MSTQDNDNESFEHIALTWLNNCMNSQEFKEVAFAESTAAAQLLTRQPLDPAQLPGKEVFATFTKHEQAYLRTRLTEEMAISASCIVAAGFLVSDSSSAKVPLPVALERAEAYARLLRSLVENTHRLGEMIAIEGTATH